MELRPDVAVISSLVLPVVFVGSLYLWRFAGFADANRDEPSTIKRRFVSSFLTCIFSLVLVFVLAGPSGSADKGLTLAELFGCQLDGLGPACLACVSLTAALFVGPLVQHLLMVFEGQVSVVDLSCENPWMFLRNCIAAPFTEEFVFRTCLIRIWFGARFPEVVSIFCSPLLFSLAHAHHCLERLRNLRPGAGARRTGSAKGQPGGARDPSSAYYQDLQMPGDALQAPSLEEKGRAVLPVVFQMFYTYLFGVYASYLLVRTGSTWALVLAHAFCNHQGFPDVGFLASSSHPLYHHRPCLAAVYCCGILAFSFLLVPLMHGFRSTFAAPAE